MMSLRAERGFDLRWSEGNGPQPHASRLKDRAANRRRHDRAGWLSAAPWHFLRPIDQIDCHFRDLRKGQDRIARPVEARYHRTIERHLLHERAAHGLHDAAFDLV